LRPADFIPFSSFEAEADRLLLVSSAFLPIMDKTQQVIALTQLRKSVEKLGSSTEVGTFHIIHQL
jgi:hypothetical protein